MLPVREITELPPIPQIERGVWLYNSDRSKDSMPRLGISGAKVIIRKAWS